MPSAWAANGEFYDRWHYFFKCLENPMAFLMALKHMGGEDLFQEPNLERRFQGVARFYLYGLEQCYANPQLHHRENATWAWLALAGQLKDPEAQWVITAEGDARGDHRRRGRRIAYLFYDPGVKASRTQASRGLGLLPLPRHGPDVH